MKKIILFFIAMIIVFGTSLLYFDKTSSSSNPPALSIKNFYRADNNIFYARIVNNTNQALTPTVILTTKNILAKKKEQFVFNIQTIKAYEKKDMTLSVDKHWDNFAVNTISLKLADNTTLTDEKGLIFASLPSVKSTASVLALIPLTFTIGVLVVSKFV